MLKFTFRSTYITDHSVVLGTRLDRFCFRAVSWKCTIFRTVLNTSTSETMSRQTLQTLLLADPSKRQLVEQALEQLVEREIATKNALIKSVHTGAKKLIPGILAQGIHLTLPG